MSESIDTHQGRRHLVEGMCVCVCQECSTEGPRGRCVCICVLCPCEQARAARPLIIQELP